MNKWIKHIIVPLAIIYFLFGLTIYKDYGFSWDESRQRKHGLVIADYINEMFDCRITHLDFADEHFPFYDRKYYGSFFQLTALFFETKLGYTEIDEIYYLRHLMTFIIFILGIIGFYYLLYEIFKSIFFPLIGLGFYIGHPRIFAHSFYNPKDIIFLSFCTLALWAFTRWFKRPNVLNSIFFGLTTALAIDVRILGVYIIPIALFFLLIYQLHELKEKIIATSIYLVSTFVFMIVFWPLLWENTFQNLAMAFGNMSQFDWGGDVLMNGHFYSAKKIPWYYGIFWISLTTPLLFLLIFILGLIKTFKSVVVESWRELLGQTDILIRLAFVAFWLAPLVAVIVFGSTLYDGWRQLFFIYPPMAFLMVVGFKFLTQKISSLVRLDYQRSKIGLTVLVFLPVIITLIRFHPLQNVYFNHLAKKPWITHYEMDYWGHGYKYAMIKLAETYPDVESFRIKGANYPCWENYRMLDEDVRERFEYQWGLDHTDYFITNYRFKEQLDKYNNRTFPLENELIQIKIGDQPIYGIYDLRK